MGFMDKVMSKAQEVTKAGQAKIDNVTGKHQMEQLYQEIGALVYSERAGRGVEDTQSQIEQALTKLQELEAAHPDLFLPPAPVAPVVIPTGEAAAAGTGGYVDASAVDEQAGAVGGAPYGSGAPFAAGVPAAAPAAAPFVPGAVPGAPAAPAAPPFVPGAPGAPAAPPFVPGAPASVAPPAGGSFIPGAAPAESAPPTSGGFEPPIAPPAGTSFIPGSPPPPAADEAGEAEDEAPPSLE